MLRLFPYRKLLVVVHVCLGAWCGCCCVCVHCLFVVAVVVVVVVCVVVVVAAVVVVVGVVVVVCVVVRVECYYPPAPLGPPGAEASLIYNLPSFLLS